MAVQALAYGRNQYNQNLLLQVFHHKVFYLHRTPSIPLLLEMTYRTTDLFRIEMLLDFFHTSKLLPSVPYLELQNLLLVRSLMFLQLHQLAEGQFLIVRQTCR